MNVYATVRIRTVLRRPEQRRLPDVQRLPVGEGQDLLHERVEDRQSEVQDDGGALLRDLGVPRAHRGRRQGREDHQGRMGKTLTY